MGYISLGRGITIHREDCPNAELLRKDPERFTNVAWEGDRSTSFVVEIQIDAWDRHRLLEDLSRVFSESGANILEARCLSTPPMVKNRFVVEVADTHTLKGAITRMRNIESVFDAYRVIPGGGRLSAGGRSALSTTTLSAPGRIAVAGLGDRAEVVAVDLQRQRAIIGSCAPSARLCPRTPSPAGGARPVREGRGPASRSSAAPAGWRGAAHRRRACRNQAARPRPRRSGDR